MKTRSRPFLVFILVGIARAGLESVPARAEEPRRFGGAPMDVVAVEVPVQVARDGRPVRGLTAADFEIYEGKKKQAITGFEAIDLGAPGAPAAVAPASTARRRFLILFDLAQSEPRSIVRARAAVQRVVDRLHPSDLVAVATHSPSNGPKFLLGFTSDRRQVAAAIDTLGFPELIKRSGDPLNLVLDASLGSSIAYQVPPEADDSFKGSAKRTAIETLIQETGEQTIRSAESERRFDTQRLADYTRALGEFSRSIARIEGRKFVVLLSEGFDSSLLLGTSDRAERESLSSAVEKGEVWKVDNDARFGSTSGGHGLEGMLEELRRANCVVQAVDIGGLRGQGGDGFARASGEDALFAIADQTGGELYRNYNDLGEAMARMLERTSVTYLLTFQPEVPRDGAYHPIRVELAKSQRGARVSYRAGYFAPRPFDPRDAAAHLLDAAAQIAGGQEGGAIATAAVAAPLLGRDGRAYVPVVVEVDGLSLLTGVDSGPLPVEIYGYALAADGAIGDFFGQTLGLDTAKARPKLEQSGLKYFAHLELPPGEWSLRILVRNGRTGRSSLRVQSLVVPKQVPATPFLSRPFFAESPAGWLMAREAPHGDQRDADYPFVLGGQPYTPATLPRLSSATRAPLAILAGGLDPNFGEGGVRVQAVVRERSGREVAGGRLDLTGREATSAGEVLAATFTPLGLAPGEYRLAVRLTVADGSTLESNPAPFEVE